MDKMTISMERHFTMFSTITEFLEKCTTLDEDRVTLVAMELLEHICKDANIEMEMADEDVDFITEGLAQAIVGALLGE